MPYLLVQPGNLHDTIPEAFQRVACAASTRTAMQITQGEGYRVQSYAGVLEQVRGLSSSLAALGLRSQGRAAIVAENRPEWVVSYLSIVACGGTAVPLDMLATQDELASFLERSQSRIIFATARTRPCLPPLAADKVVVNIDGSSEPGDLAFGELVAEGLRKEPPQAVIAPDDVASLLYTSGTTKQPKGVLLTHRNFMANAKAVLGTGLAGPDDNFLVILPFHHAYPFMVAFLVPLLLGAKRIRVVDFGQSPNDEVLVVIEPVDRIDASADLVLEPLTAVGLQNIGRGLFVSGMVGPRQLRAPSMTGRAALHHGRRRQLYVIPRRRGPRSGGLVPSNMLRRGPVASLAANPQLRHARPVKVLLRIVILA